MAIRTTHSNSQSGQGWLIAPLGGAAALAAALFLPAGTALAHGGHPPDPEHLWTAWNWEPGILISLGLLAGAYFRGVRAVWRRAGAFRGISSGQLLAFCGSLAVFFIALVSPLDSLGEALFSAHMVQHLVLILVAAPLLVFSAPQVALVWALPYRLRRHLAPWWRRQTVLRSMWGALSQPLVIWAVYTLILWAWHMPRFYQAALESKAVHSFEHASFVFAALLFWWLIDRYLHPTREKASVGAGLLFVFTTALHSGLLGALLTFASHPWYPIYSETAALWNITTLQDQQLAGVIMWVPMGIVYLFTALAILGRWLLAAEASETPESGRIWQAPPMPGSRMLDRQVD